jgi:hypothetical protein
VRYSLRTFIAAACGAFTGIALLSALPASADTTYYYTGSPYTVFQTDPRQTW